MGLFDRFNKKKDEKQAQNPTSSSTQNLEEKYKPSIELESYINELKEAGYGESTLSDFKKRLSDIVLERSENFYPPTYQDYDKINKMIEDEIKSRLAYETRAKVSQIKHDKESLESSCDIIKNRDLSETEKCFELLYRDTYKQYPDRSFSGDIKKINIKLEKTQFDVQHGNNNNIETLRKLSKLLTTKCQLLGYGSNDEREAMNRRINEMSSISEIEQYNTFLSDTIYRNEKNIKAYFGSIELIDNIAKTAYPTLTTRQVIENFLAFNDAKLANHYEYIDKKCYKNTIASFNEHINSVNPTIRRTDKKGIDFEKNSSILYSNDKTNSAPGNSVSSPSNDKLTLKNTVENALQNGQTTTDDVLRANNQKTFVKKKKIVKGMD